MPFKPDFAETPVNWRKTGDPDQPFDATVAGERWQVRINRSPGDARYTLLIDDAAVLDLTDWPNVWDRNGAYAK